MAQAVIAVALVAAAGVSAYGAIAQGQAAEEAAEYNAKINENAAQAASFQAQAEAEQVRRRNVAILGRQKALLSKGGVTLSGSAEDLIYDSMVQGEFNRLSAEYGGNVQASYYQSRARLGLAEGRNARTAGYYGAASAVLSGGAGAASSYYSSRNGTVQGPGGSYARGTGTHGTAYYPTFTED